MARIDDRLDAGYRYDHLGNLLAKEGVGYAYGANGDGTGAGPHQARSVGGDTYTYDANGNLATGGGRTYAWNADNQPTSITGSDAVREDTPTTPTGSASSARGARRRSCTSAAAWSRRS